ncbi:Cysteine/serine-rich nuclear protein 1 [Clonorchis sinensis]|uniref:Cysteine/serine-rich nuclear protein 1 n=1 Tax=Clonorchis sinensis TaxID=79923 RepID=A0A3R7D4I1_CLOSI|nr:Cysteine/serine-rich nuclear protein 1 [Clonorchis sinensis]
MEPVEEVGNAVETLENAGQPLGVTSVSASDPLTAESQASLCKLRRVRFEKVEVFYFERLQGFVCVPSQGGSTLGMAQTHSAFEEFTVADHQHVRQFERYLALLRKFESGKISLTSEQLSYLTFRIKSAPDLLCKRLFHRLQDTSLVSGHNGAHPDRPPLPLCEETSSRTSSLSNLKLPETNPESPHICDEEMESQLCGLIECYFLQLLSIKKRRLLLRKSGLKSIDHAERIECQAIRMSREICGCSCPSGVCLPDTCYCARNGIKCQVDRPYFPCCCVQPSQCQNPEGRIEFDPIRVRTHYLHTRMRLDKQQIAHSLGTGGWSMSSHQQSEEPNSKRPRLDPTNTVHLPTCSQDFEAVHGCTTSSCDNENAESVLPSSSQDDELLSRYNTTSHGACRDCQNDRYVHMLMQQLEADAPEDGSEVGSFEQVDTGFSLAQPPGECLEFGDGDLLDTLSQSVPNGFHGTQTSNLDTIAVEVPTDQPVTQSAYPVEQFSSCPSEVSVVCGGTLLTSQPSISLECRQNRLFASSDNSGHLTHNASDGADNHLQADRDVSYHPLPASETRLLSSLRTHEDPTNQHQHSSCLPLEPISSLFYRCASKRTLSPQNPIPLDRPPTQSSVFSEDDYFTSPGELDANDSSSRPTNPSASSSPLICTSPSDNNSTLPSTLDVSAESPSRPTSQYVEGVTA